ncbi:MAG: hypothetical protein ACE5JQ_17855 [Candidatus Methylomirabilales bacterium]
MRKIGVFILVLPLLVVLSAPLAFALPCPELIEPAQDAIDQAALAMAKLPKNKQGLVHTLIDDAKMQLASAKHNCEKPAAGDYDHARAHAKAGAATAYAKAAEGLAKKMR